MTRGLCELFGSVDAIDVSPEMISRAHSALDGYSNVRFHVNNGLDLRLFRDRQFDFAFSAIVFQHIPSTDIVQNYIAETFRVLRDGAFFKFQVQGCSIPDESLDTWVGVGFSELEMAELAKRVGFRIVQSSGAGTQEYWLTLRKS